MHFESAAAQVLKKIVPPSGKIYRQLHLISQYAGSFKRLKKLKTLVVNTHITDHCNLNCACCNQFSPLICESFCDVESFKKDFSRLVQLGGKKIEKIVFSGGEPLLHPNVTGFFDAARECFDNYRGGGGDSLHNQRDVVAEKNGGFLA
ncbi:MAG: hypothetical protein LBC27_10485 [Spirochaetaceae bacterium]|jgi:uncharacterized radical SAM superfamily Fe-S cluster-containing enzyme|nr:hypothetical protein [Spirochaetaceae bacterium]